MESTETAASKSRATRFLPVIFQTVAACAVAVVSAGVGASLGSQAATAQYWRSMTAEIHARAAEVLAPMARNHVDQVLDDRAIALNNKVRDVYVILREDLETLESRVAGLQRAVLDSQGLSNSRAAGFATSSAEPFARRVPAPELPPELRATVDRINGSRTGTAGDKRITAHQAVAEMMRDRLRRELEASRSHDASP